jgi:uncharacterized sulfatase
VVDDFVRLPDLAPTFMEIGGVTPPADLYGRSLLKLLRSDGSGQVEADRTWVITGRERHVEDAREGYLPYPMRALRTKDFVYIRNFAADRAPMGDAKTAVNAEVIASGRLENDTRIGFADMDGSPTKAWLIAHRDDPQWKWYYEHAFGNRPTEELYDLRKDRDQVKNVATNPEYAKVKNELAADLMKKLTDAKDPRVTGDGKTFDRPPFAGPLPDEDPGARGERRKNGKNKKAELD